MAHYGESRRVARGRGDDIRGRTIRSRTGGIDTDMLSPLEKGLVARQLREDLKGVKPKPAAKGSAPAPYALTGGSGFAHTGKHGAPTIYAEKYQGRKGGRGKRV